MAVKPLFCSFALIRFLASDSWMSWIVSNSSSSLVARVLTTPLPLFRSWASSSTSASFFSVHSGRTNVDGLAWFPSCSLRSAGSRKRCFTAIENRLVLSFSNHKNNTFKGLPSCYVGGLKKCLKTQFPKASYIV